jgi:hypothetical protein
VIGTIQATARRHFALHWLLLAAIFGYLAIDEGTKIHEEALDFLIPVLGIHFLHFWVIPASVIMLGFVAAYWRFLWALPPSTARLFILAGSIYVGGAIGMETLGGLYAEAHGKANFKYLLLADTEEILEMMGMIVFTYTLLGHLQRIIGGTQPRAIERLAAPGATQTGRVDS